MKQAWRKFVKALNKPGRGAEFLARCYLRIHGYQILHQNYVVKIRRHVGAGELDIIARRGKILAFVEVKSRSSYEKALYAVKPRQRQRLIRAAQCFLQDYPQYAEYNLRFDAVLVYPPFRIKHIPDAWRPE